MDTRVVAVCQAASLAAAGLVAIGVAPARSAAPVVTQEQSLTMHVTVRDKAGAMVRGLTREDFVIIESGQPLQVATVENTPQPISAALLLDMNGAPVEVPWLRDAALGFIEAMTPGDRVRLGTFGDEIFLSAKLTDDRAYLQWLLQDELWASYSSPVWHAVERAVGSLEDVSGRRTVVVLSNGYATTPPRLRPIGSGRAIERAERARAGVHVVTFERPELDVGLRRLAERTGGSFVTIKDLSFAPAIFADIVGELHDQYAVGFVPAAWDGESHDIQVRVTRPGATVRAPTRYHAAGRQR